MSFLNSLFGKKESPVSSTIETLGSSMTNLVSEVNPLESMTAKEKNELGNQLNHLTSLISYFLLVVVPLLFAPMLADSFDLPKQTVLFFLAGLSLLFFLIKGLIDKKTLLTVSPLHLPVLAFMLVTVVSSFLADNKLAALSADTVYILGASFLFFSLSALGSAKENFLEKAVKCLLFSGSALSVLSAIQLIFQLLPHSLTNSINLINSVSFVFSPSFSPAGSSLSQGLFLLVLLPLAVGQYINSKRKTIPLVLLGLNILGILTTAYVLYISKPILLDQLTGWKIAINSLGGAPQILNAFFGVGPGHFVDAFGSFKPASFNDSAWWNLRFSTSSNFYFYVQTTLGFAGLASLLFLVVRITKIAKSRLQTDNVTTLEKALIGSIFLSLILFALCPAGLISIFTFFAAMGLLINLYRQKGLSLFAREIDLSNSSAKYFLPAGLALILLGWAYLPTQNFGLLQYVYADAMFAQSLQAARLNNGQQTYNLQISALSLNPYNSSYRISYSQTNLALANSLAGQNPPAGGLTDQQKQIVVQLVQQALREGRIAASLQPRRAGNWENLSLIYRNLINFAQGADQWAVQAEQQAVQLDPTNPRLRLDLGGILFAAKDFQNAAQIFNGAVSLKSDFANAHYNLAQTLKELKLNDQALRELQQTAQLVCTPTRTNPQAASSNDCKKVTAEINDLTKEIDLSKTAAPAAIKPGVSQTPLASPGATPITNLPKAKTVPPAQVGSQSGEINP